MSRGKTALPLDLPRPDGLSAPGASKQQVTFDALRDAILARHLPADSRLPSTRALAQRWALSRGTLEVVFERLHSEGYVVRVAGSGTRVCAVIPERFLAVPVGAHVSQKAAINASAARRRVHTEVADLGVQSHVAFVARLPDARLFDAKAWSRCIAQGLQSLGPEGLTALYPDGSPALRELIADYLRTCRGLHCEAEDVVVTTGIRHGIDLVARTLLKPFDKVCVEDPGYQSARHLFGLAGAQLAYVPVDSYGLDDVGLAAHGDARLVCVTPAHQAPLGCTMSVSRRLALLDWANRTDTWVLEDDYDSEFNYQSAPLAALKALDRNDRVIYCGSFNKLLFAGLRVGFMVVPTSLRGKVLDCLHATGRSVGITEQAGLVALLQGRGFGRHLRAARQAYQLRRDTLLACLAETAPGRYRISGQQAGLHCVLWLPEAVDEGRFCQQAAECGLALQPLGNFCQTVSLPPAVVLGYTALTLAQVRVSAQQLGRLLAQFSPRS